MESRTLSTPYRVITEWYMDSRNGSHSLIAVDRLAGEFACLVNSPSFPIFHREIVSRSDVQPGIQKLVLSLGYQQTRARHDDDWLPLSILPFTLPENS